MRFYPFCSKIVLPWILVLWAYLLAFGQVPQDKLSKREVRHMFEKQRGEMSEHGVLAWMGTGSLAENPSQCENWLPSFVFRYRYEVQTRMNLKIDIGIGKETSGFYFNFNEVF